MAIEEIRNERIQKEHKLRESGIDTYPVTVVRSHTVARAVEKFAQLQKSEKSISVAGRIMAKREHGGSTFMDLVDETGMLQIYFKKDVLGDQYALLLRAVDIGDFLGCTGTLFMTKKDERSLACSDWKMLTKSLHPLPEKWHGLQDVEERYRKRYLDLIMNVEVRDRFRLRSSLVCTIRNFFDKEDYLEVETPIFHPIPGGALARPFVTHHEALDIDLYLRIAPELYLKRLLVGGFERVYEIGKLFRNEGIDATHNPEFTTIEWYAAYMDDKQMMTFVERCITYILKQLNITSPLTFDDKEIMFTDKFTRLRFKDVLKRYALIVNYDEESRDEMAIRARQFGIDVDEYTSKGKIADEIFKKICRPHLVNPTFVTDHPIDISPLAKRGEREEEVHRFQLVIGGIELANAFSELNDPMDQRRRFEEQDRMHASGEVEAHAIDNEYIEALEYGMPPAAGVGMSIDRLVMLLTNTKNIREVVLFPTMRPK